MLKAWDQADINVGPPSGRGMRLQGGVAGNPSVFAHSERTGAQARSGTTGTRPPPPRISRAAYVSVVGVFQDFRIVATALPTRGISCSDFECGARLRASPRDRARVRHLSRETTRARDGRYRHPKPRARGPGGRRPFERAWTRWRFSWKSCVAV